MVLLKCLSRICVVQISLSLHFLSLEPLLHYRNETLVPLCSTKSEGYNLIIKVPVNGVLF